MVKFHGAVDYIILKNNHQYFLFFLDNHNPENYCSIPAENINSLFQHFIDNDKNTTFIFEELLDDTRFISLFPNITHLDKYLKFYHKYKSNNSHPIDIRILFDNTNLSNIFTNFDILFDDNINNFTDDIINKIKVQIDSACKKSSIFLEQFTNFKEHFLIIKQTVTNNNILIDIIKKNQFTNENTDLNYPWLNNKVIPTIENMANLWEQFINALLELYAISFIIQSESKTTISYLGASHCITIFNILEKYYNYRNIKKFLNYDLTKMDTFNLFNLESIYKSCINFTNN